MEQNEEMRVIAVRDDDHNIFKFRGASSKYLETLIREKNAAMYELVENYRNKSKLVDFTNQFGLILGMFSEKEEQAIKALQQFTEAENKDKCLEDLESSALSNSQTREVIEKVLNSKPTKILQEMSKADRDMVLHKLKELEGLSIRQISRLTDERFNIVKRAK